MRKLVLSAMALALTVVLVGCGEEKPATKPAATAAPMMATTPAMKADEVKK
ncbi:MAG: hypothetical protein WCT04_21670 [Planctomycetota bacterium]